MIWGGGDVILTEIKCTTNAVCLNHPQTITSSPVCGKRAFHKTSPWCQKGWGPLHYRMYGSISGLHTLDALPQGATCQLSPGGHNHPHLRPLIEWLGFEPAQGSDSLMTLGKSPPVARPGCPLGITVFWSLFQLWLFRSWYFVQLRRKTKYHLWFSDSIRSGNVYFSMRLAKVKWISQ